MRGHHQPLHPETRMALADLRRAGGKAIVLLNRRGWSNFLSCRACGQVWMCPNCEVALVLHRHGGYVACHHCGHRERVPERCPALRLGVGGPPRRRDRADRARAARGARRRAASRSSASTPTRPRSRRRARTLQAFDAARRRACWSAPRWWPRATTSPTSRSASCSTPTRRCASPTSAPRSGRSRSSPSWPGAPAADRRARAACSCRRSPRTRARSRFAARHDSDGFLADELRRREALGYPPFATLIRIVCSAPEEAAGARDRGRPARRARRRSTRRVLGPAPLFRLRGRARQPAGDQGGRPRRPAIDAVGAAVDAVAPGAARRGVSVSVDVDPQ